MGKWLGALVGALVLGTAFPHLLKVVSAQLDSTELLLVVSGIAVSGGIILHAFVGDGPYRKPATQFSFISLKKAFAIPDFRNASIGYFGHMWELYALWAFIPWLVELYKSQNNNLPATSLLSFFAISIGAIGCAVGGLISARHGSKRVANIALLCSGMCCIFSPFIFESPPIVFMAFLAFWGLTVTADSPQFSSLVASSVPAEIKGSAITLVTCIGFSITIVSIQLLSYLRGVIPNEFLLFILGLGPTLGLIVPRMWQSH